MPEFTIGGRKIQLTKEEVVKKLKGAKLGRIQTHAVEVGGALFPIKRAFAKVSEVDILDFNTIQARNVFRELGFPVRRLV